MAWTATTFKARWPEFAPTDDARVEAALADAAEYSDVGLFGDRHDLAVGLYAAHLLATSPAGQHSRLESDKADTTYRAEWERMARQVAAGPWTIGQRL